MMSKVFSKGLLRSTWSHFQLQSLSSEASGSYGWRLNYSAHGKPSDVLSLSSMPIQIPGINEITIRMLAAPINPADINQIEGTYPRRPALPAVGGNEGVGEVIAVHPSVTNFSVGAWVLPTDACLGTWQSHITCSASKFIQVPNDISVAMAAMIAVNPCTAYRVLHDFVSLKPGDMVIQNGSNSGVGLSVIQLAKYLGLITVNIVRGDREDFPSLAEELHRLGGDYVVTEKEVQTSAWRDKMKTLPPPRLGLNCVGGRSATNLIRLMGRHGCVVTYGGMSKEPLTVPTGALIFEDITLRGYWMTRWNETSTIPQREEMIAAIADLIRRGKFSLPYHGNKLGDYGPALANATAPYKHAKEIFIM